MTTLDSARLKELDVAHHLHPRTNLKRFKETGPFVVERASGVYVEDVDGRRYIDGLAGLWNVNVGHGREELAETAAEQMRSLAFSPVFNGVSHPSVIQLAAKLAEIYPGHVNHFQFTSGGSESTESAVKIARYFWSVQGRPEKVKILSRSMAYHGIAMGVLPATGIPAFWQHFGPLPDGYIHLTPPYAYRHGEGIDEDAFIDVLVAELEATIAREGAGTIAAMIGEPVQGAGGVVVPPDGYWPRVAEVLRANDILLIADEVITGFGRTGAMFGAELYGYEPDLAAMAKGITSGYVPLGAVGVSDRIADVMYEQDAVFMHGFTYSGHPVATAVALRNLQIIEDEGLVQNAAKQGAYLLDRLQELSPHPNVGEVRGKGLMMIIEFVKDKATKERFPTGDNLGPRLVAASRSRGLNPVISDVGMWIAPPLVITQAECDQLVDAIHGAVVDVLGPA